MHRKCTTGIQRLTESLVKQCNVYRWVTVLTYLGGSSQVGVFIALYDDVYT
jgi:hypothetical protein